MSKKWLSWVGLSSWSSFLWPESGAEAKRQIIAVLVMLPFAAIMFLVLRAMKG